MSHIANLEEEQEKRKPNNRIAKETIHGGMSLIELECVNV